MKRLLLTIGLLSATGLLQAHDLGPESLAKPYALSGDTHTYVRCYYRVDNDSRKPASDYVWALDKSGSYYALHGRWAASGAFQWSNMFYSDVSQNALVDICKSTLGNRSLVMFAAADNVVSFNYAVWSNDRPDDGKTLTRLISFGDSLSDTMNVFNLSNWLLPHRQSWSVGRFSNGPVWSENVAAQTGLSLATWAIGGAAADNYIVVPGMRQQVESWISYRKLAPNYNPERSLITVMIGANDLLSYGRPVDQALNTVRQSLDRLIADGARHIMLMNLPDISRAPEFKMRDDGAQIAQQTHQFNAGIAAMHAQLLAAHGSRVQLHLFDTFTLFNNILDNPATHELDNVTDSCLDIRKASSLNYVKAWPVTSACTNADRYAFWDLLHPSRRTHELFGKAVAEFIAEHYDLK